MRTFAFCLISLLFVGIVLCNAFEQGGATDTVVHDRAEVMTTDPETKSPSERDLGVFAAILGIISATHGIAATTLGLASMDRSSTPSGLSGAVITVKLGMNCLDDKLCPGQVDRHKEGSIAEIVGYDLANTGVGRAGGGPKIESGGVATYTLDQDSPGAQTRYLSIGAKGDGVCIQTVQVDQADGVEAASGTWTGDIARHCCKHYGWGGQIAGKFKNKDDEWEEWYPSCLWVDGNKKQDTVITAFKFDVLGYVGNFTDKKALEASIKRACKNTLFATGGKRIDKWHLPLKPVGKIGAGEMFDLDGAEDAQPAMEFKQRKDWMAEALYISRKASIHNAKEFCADPYAYGPDVVGSDGYYCDMDTRKAVPLCETEDVDGCMVLGGKILQKRSHVTKRIVHAPHREFKVVHTIS